MYLYQKDQCISFLLSLLASGIPYRNTEICLPCTVSSLRLAKKSRFQFAAFSWVWLPIVWCQLPFFWSCSLFINKVFIFCRTNNPGTKFASLPCVRQNLLAKSVKKTRKSVREKCEQTSQTFRLVETAGMRRGKTAYRLLTDENF